MSDYLDKTSESLESLKDKVNEAQEKAGNDAEGLETANVLFNGITELAINILKDPMVKKSFDIMEKDLSEETVGAIVNLLAICMSTSAYNAIVFYDDLLKGELTRQFDHMGKYINDSRADLIALQAITSVHKAHLGKIDKILEISEFMKKNNISEEDLQVPDK